MEPTSDLNQDEAAANERAAIVIQRGLPPEQALQAAREYYEAFRTKCAWFGPAERIIRVLCASFVLDNAVVALQHGSIVGMAGFKLHGKPLLQLRFTTCIRELGLIRGALAYVLYRIFDRQPARDELLMDGLYVGAQCRGQGVGTKLLDAICDVAREQGLMKVRLQVVDTNADAQRLYERLGFRVDEQHDYPWARRLLGFGKVITLMKRLQV